jgi:hypothetical protein
MEMSIFYERQPPFSYARLFEGIDFIAILQPSVNKAECLMQIYVAFWMTCANGAPAELASGKCNIRVHINFKLEGNA